MTPTLDWRDSRHWNRGRCVPCVRCGTGTHLLDDAVRPSHKWCAELERDMAAAPAQPQVLDGAA